MNTYDQNKYLCQKNIEVFACVSVLSLLIVLLTKTISLTLFLTIEAILLGLANGIYWFYMLFQKKLDRIVVILVICLGWPILHILGVLTLIPIILYDFVVILKFYFTNMNKEKTGQQEKSITKEEVICFEKNKKKYSILFIIAIILLIVVLAIINIPLIPKLFFGAAGIIICFVLKNSITAKLQVSLNNILYESCDSKTYYHIYKYLNNKYPKDYTILQNYVIALRFDENDYSELKTIIHQYPQYKSHIFYMRAMIDIANPEDKRLLFDNLYKESLLFNTKMYKKTKKSIWDTNIKLLEAEKLIFNNQYQNALDIYGSIIDDNIKINSIEKAFMKGKCFINLEMLFEARKEFEYVIKEGHTLRMCTQAKKYLEQIDASNN